MKALLAILLLLPHNLEAQNRGLIIVEYSNTETPDIFEYTHIHYDTILPIGILESSEEASFYYGEVEEILPPFKTVHSVTYAGTKFEANAILKKMIQNEREYDKDRRWQSPDIKIKSVRGGFTITGELYPQYFGRLYIDIFVSESARTRKFCDYFLRY